MEIIKGDLIQLALEGKFDMIAHGCNCFGTQRSGIAKQMVEVFNTDNIRLYPGEHPSKRGDVNKLGTIECTWLTCRFEDDEHSLAVVNCYTQYYNRSNAPDNYGPCLDYEALTLCMRKINHDFRGKHIGLPRIGAGLAGGDWDRIYNIIETELQDLKVTIVEL